MAQHEVEISISKTGEVKVHVKNAKGNSGYDVASDKYCDLFQAGIIDPTKVVRIALQNAASVGNLLITTECVVTEIPEKEKAMPAPGGGGDMDDMM